MRTLRLVCFVLGATAITVPAAADDVSPLSPSPIAATITNWSGFYLGGHLGGGFGTSGVGVRKAGPVEGPDPSLLTAFLVGLFGGTDTSGLLGGGQLGYNYQLDNNIVIGAEADISGAAFSGRGGTVTALAVPPIAPGGHVSGRTDFITDVTGRLGYVNDQWLWYAKGGGAWSHNSYDVVTSTGVDWHWSGVHSGWTVGGGIEWLFRPGWSAKAEYQYYDFGGPGTLSNPAHSTVAEQYTQFVHAFTVGLNYHF